MMPHRTSYVDGCVSVKKVRERGIWRLHVVSLLLRECYFLLFLKGNLCNYTIDFRSIDFFKNFQFLFQILKKK